VGGEKKPHIFGGGWTEVKLEAISDYLNFYNKALRYKPSPSSPFERWYIDAFAGSGTRSEHRSSGGLLEGRPIGKELITVAGSAQRALAVDPPFHRLVFIEGNQGRFRQLCELRDAFPDREIDCRNRDANTELTGIFASPPWSSQVRGRGRHRAVAFLDPYGMGVKWQTLDMLAKTAAVDVWYLFPLNAVVRQLAHDMEAVDESKMMALSEIFGTTEWVTELYQTEVSRDLFRTDHSKTRRIADQQQIEAYVKKRLETIFTYVSDPLPLLADDSSLQKFSLFCATGSTSPYAVDLIKRGVKHVLKKYAPASRRRSGP
jgi:three-Cys-motif partner protein